MQDEDAGALAFVDIYRRNLWGSAESASGPGSERAYAAGLAEALPALFQKFGVTRVFYAPCGDLNWMRAVVAKTGVDYCGVDIVALQ